MPVYDHKKYADRSDSDLQNRAQAKEQEFDYILKYFEFPRWELPRVIVLGCPDKRMIPQYLTMFESRLNARVNLTVIDKVVDHLPKEGVMRHDATLPFPNTPYDLVYAHVLLKFISKDGQWAVLENAYDALSVNGVALFILDKEDYETSTELQRDGWNSVPIETWKEKMAEKGMQFSIVPFSLEDSVSGPKEIRGVSGIGLIIFK
jgi:hypothetical protein